MATLKAIKKRIGATKGTKKLTRAMKMIAASRLRKVQSKVIEARIFQGEVERILIEMIKRGVKVDHPLILNPSEGAKEIALIIFTSDRGMCGTYNENLLKEVSKYIKERSAEGLSVSCYIFGKKGRDFFKRSELDSTKQMIGLTESSAKDFLNSDIAQFSEKYSEGAIKEVVLAFNGFKSAGSSKITFKRLIPAAPPGVDYQHTVDYIYEPARAEILEWLIKEFIKSNFYQAYLESFASEQFSRMTAMDKATKNAEDMINGLTLQMNKVRQGIITRDLIDIVGSANAIK